MKYALDSNTIIHFINGTYDIMQERFRAVNPIDVKIPAIVEAELAFGSAKSQRKKENIEKLRQFLSRFEILPFESEAAWAYAEIRTILEKKGNPIGPNDLLIAATAMVNNCTLITQNTKEFARISGLRTNDWTC